MVGTSTVPLRTKLAWGIGSASEKIVLAAVGSFAFFYYNQILGLPATETGIATSASLIVGGLFDPVIGIISDRTRSRLGRRHPYMLGGPLPLAVCLFALYHPPHALVGVWLVVWLTALITSVRVFMTMFHTPHLALGGELSGDYTERSTVMAYNTFFGFTAEALVGWTAFTVFFHSTASHRNGLTNPEGYGNFGLTAACVALVLLLGSAWFTLDVVKRLPQPSEGLSKLTPLAFFQDIGKAFANINYVYLLVAFFFLSCTLGMHGGLLLYVRTFFWGLTSEQMRWFVLGDTAGYIFSFFAVARLNARFEKRETIVGAGIIMCLVPIIAPVARVAGVFPAANSQAFLPLLIGLSGVYGCAMTMVGITVMSALADIADENELKYGVRQEGVLYSTRTLFSTIDVAVGGFLGAMTLDIIHFPAHAQPGHVAQQVITRLALTDALLPAVPGLFAVVFYSRYRINRASHDATKAKLGLARAERASSGATSPVESPTAADAEAAVELIMPGAR